MSRGSSLDHLQTIASTMADREEKLTFGSRPSLTNIPLGNISTHSGGSRPASRSGSFQRLDKFSSTSSKDLRITKPTPERPTPSKQPKIQAEQPKPFVPKEIEVSIEPVTQNGRPTVRNSSWSKWAALPDWLMLTTAYSAVLVSILLIGNVTPDGKLFIYFTAFWSLLLYFFTEDTADFYSKDPMDSMAEGFLVKRV